MGIPNTDMKVEFKFIKFNKLVYIFENTRGYKL